MDKAKESNNHFPWLTGGAIVMIFCVSIALIITLPKLPIPNAQGKVIKMATPDLCVPASAAQIEKIRSAVKSKAEYNDIGKAFAFRSMDFQQVYFVAARIIGPGINENKPIIGVWATNGDPDKPGLLYSAEYIAFEFSGMGLSSKTDAKITMQSDGAKAAYDCVYNQK